MNAYTYHRSITVKTVNIENYQSKDFFLILFTFKIDGDIGKFVQIPVY